MKKKKPPYAVGTLRMHPRGFGFLQPNDTTRFPEDIFIPKHLTKTAVDGDIVEVEVGFETQKGPEGRVISIIQRSRTHIAGIVTSTTKKGAYVFVPLFGKSKTVTVTPIDERPLKVGDRLIMKVLDWGFEGTQATCEMSHYLGSIDDPSCDVTASIEEYGLRSDFPAAVIKEAKKLGKKVKSKEIQERVDLRELECFTIDPDTAKDFDDALSLKLENGIYELGVHIADVSHYVKIGSPLDEEAKLRCNSTYFPGFCLPMLPHELSSELCSLKPDVDRLTISVMMRFDKKGSLLDFKIFKSAIHSQRRFTYKEAKQILDGKLKSPHARTLKLMVSLCHLLRKQRFERGSIEFALPDIVVLVDEKGVPLGFEHVEYDITHQLVEEFALKANEVVAKHLTDLGKPLTYRVHDEPLEESIEEFTQLARAFGFKLPNKPRKSEMQKLFQEASSTPFGPYLAASYIRTMKLAYYSPVNEGHFGLSLEHYCHFTSPIRRYIDLVIHRIVCGEEHELEHLSKTAHACSEQERISAKAEGACTLLKKLRFLSQQDPHRRYKAIVTRIKNRGIVFEIPEFMMDGFLHVSELKEDYFLYNEEKMILTGQRTGKIYACGTPLTLQLVELDFITLETKWKIRTAK